MAVGESRSDAQTTRPSLPAPRSIAVIVAMKAELRHLLESVGVEREDQDGIWLDYFLTVGDVPVVAVRSGMGMVNAAAATERLICSHEPRAILNFGCSGAHRRDILPGDVIIGERFVHHGAVHILASGEEHYTGFGYEVGGEAMAAADLPADPDLLALAWSASTAWQPEPWPKDLGWPSAIPYRTPEVHTGAVASADIWTQAHARIDLLHQRHGTLCEDMEAAAIAHVCAMHAVPFLAIKDISNNEFQVSTDIAGGFTDFPTAEVGKRAAALTLRLLARIDEPSRRGVMK